MAAGIILAGLCAFAPQQLKAEVPEAQMDGVMGQSIKEEMEYTVPQQKDTAVATYSIPALLSATALEILS